MLLQSIVYVVGAGAIAAAGVASQHGGSLGTALLASFFAFIASDIIKYGSVRRHLTLGEATQDTLSVGILALSANTSIKVWQAPTNWSQLCALTAPASAIAGIVYLLAVTYTFSTTRKHLSLSAGFALVCTPYLFNALLLLQSPPLLEQLGRITAFSTQFPPIFLQWIGKALVLIVLNEAALTISSVLLTGRIHSDARIHGLFTASALVASVTPMVARLGSTPMSACSPSGMNTLATIAATMASQAGLWAQTFLLTGLLMDALQGKNPSWIRCSSHFTSGFSKGLIYSGVLMAMVHAIAGYLSQPVLKFLLIRYPVVSACLIGAIVFPFLKTIVESFDGSKPFFQRLTNSYASRIHLLRGAVVGISVVYALRENISFASESYRFLYGCLAGAASYGFVNFCRDIFHILVLHKRLSLQSPRIYVTEAILGSMAGGALFWYLDPTQTGVVITKFTKYATISYALAEIPIEDYIIYPLFSKWGAMNLGPVNGGSSLLYCEALSGVINWSLAAPLFSVNLVMLNALIQKSTAPLKHLLSRQGLVDLIDQAFRVQRWGLWMAPVIYSFLRLSPDPTWYNQDGALRTMVAIFKFISSTPEDFRTWSLNLFTSLLAFDWLRIFIFIDHMGLRVATLVNLSFVGLDVIDEKIARFFGHSARTRVIPPGIRRFVTWAPLLIPFYIPRGAEWDYAWNQAEALSRSHPQELLPPGVVAGGFLFLALCTGSILCARRMRSSHHQPLSRTSQCITPSAERASPHCDNNPFTLTNGIYTLTLTPDGRSFSQVLSAVQKGCELDLTRRSCDPLEPCGKFFYLIDRDAPTDLPPSVWSLTYQPAHRVGDDYCLTRRDKLSLQIVNTYRNIRAEAIVKIDPYDPVEIWALRLTNGEARIKTLELITYQEFVLNVPDAYLRHPDFNNIHIGTWFIPTLHAIIAHNRLLKDGHRDPTRRTLSPEVAFHAVNIKEKSNVQLKGYEDSRSFFIGSHDLSTPEYLSQKPRSPADDGLLYTFDPLASLSLSITLPPKGSIELLFLNGYAPSIAQAVTLMEKHLTHHSLSLTPLQESLNKRRRLRGFPLPEEESNRASLSSGEAPFAFSPDGTELMVSCITARPWTHILSNELGYGILLTNEGSIYSFMGNSQQNGLTPPFFSSTSVQNPGQVLYLYHLSTGELDSPTSIPFRKKGDAATTTFGRGYAVYQKTSGDIDLELTIWVLPDEPAEIRILKVRNRSSADVRYRVVPYFQIVLGEIPSDTRGRITTFYRDSLRALFFSNEHNDFQKGIAFVATSLMVERYETVRTRFVGGTGRDFTHPYMVEYGIPDSSTPDDGYRIASFSGYLTVPAGSEKEIVIVMGQTAKEEQAKTIINAYCNPAAAHSALERTKRFWSETLSVLRIETNNPAFDRLVNDWLPYQILTSHLWGRLGPNQRSGAYGFRDQLQDMLPLLFLHPALARKQILFHGAQQFLEGDVLQWWHQSWEGKSGLGVRNRASDPHLWLPYLVYHYVEATGDLTILEEEINFLEGKRIPPGTEGVVFAPRPSRDRASLYHHCTRAIEFTLARLGTHGLPLLGTGDWNDGLNLLGFRGRGESIWLGFFLYDILTHFSKLAELKEGLEKRRFYLDYASKLKNALYNMWRDGCYVRATTDQGEEITFYDALTAAWPLLSGAVDNEQGTRALEEGLKHLEVDNLVRLLFPPFHEHSYPNPGKLADYPPGVRENGGQYSHGASWLVDALVKGAEHYRANGDITQAELYLEKAVRIWMKISPILHTAPEVIDRYGLPPHQQPADIYYGQGYEGRGGWSWYTGAAARMLLSAYKLLGLSMKNGVLTISEQLFDPKGPLHVKRLIYRGVEHKRACGQR